jgi:hypothetical protein
MSIKKDEQEISLIKKHLKKTSIPQKKKILKNCWFFHESSTNNPYGFFPKISLFPWFSHGLTRSHVEG